MGNSATFLIGDMCGHAHVSIELRYSKKLFMNYIYPVH